MVKTPLFLIPAAAALLILAACAGNPPAVPEGDVLLPEIDIVTVKEHSDEALKIAQETKLDMEVLNSRVTEINNQLLNFSEEMASVSSTKIEELENRVIILTEELKKVYFELDSLRKKVNVAPRKTQPSIFDANVFAPGKDEQLLSLPADQRRYRQGQNFFNAGQYVNAVVAFKEALKTAPQGKEADNAQFWTGECYFKLGQYAYAIANFKKVFSYTNSEKADDAQMRIAIAYSKLGDNEQAVVEFKNLLKIYPQSEFTGEARKYISQLE